MNGALSVNSTGNNMPQNETETPPLVDGMVRIGGDSTSVPDPLGSFHATYNEFATATVGPQLTKINNNNPPPLAAASATTNGFTTATVGVAVPIKTQDVPNNYKQYSAPVAKFLSQVSGWSYSDKETYQNQLSCVPLADTGTEVLVNAYYWEFKVRNEPLFIHSTAQFIMTHDKKIAVISFRGTELTNLINWAADASTKKVPFFDGSVDNNVKVHLGFKLNFKAVWYGPTGILNTLHTCSNDIEAIYITGHSLGGAMAVLAGLALKYQNPSLFNKVAGIYTYGQPMVVDDSDREKLQKRIGSIVFRHIYFNDIVPHLPPLSVGSYDHVGDEYRYYPWNGSWKKREDADWAISRIWTWKDRITQVGTVLGTLPFLIPDYLTDSIPWKLPGFRKAPWSIADHSPANYMGNWS